MVRTVRCSSPRREACRPYKLKLSQADGCANAFVYDFKMFIFNIRSHPQFFTKSLGHAFIMTVNAISECVGG